MEKIINSVYWLFDTIYTSWWLPLWSSIRWSKVERFNALVNNEDKATTYKEVQVLASKLYKKFTYIQDDITQLKDSIVPPPYAYSMYLQGELKDDCDGFHSLLWHCLRNSGIVCYLYIVQARHCGHCVLTCRLNGKWHLVDYTKVYKGHETLQECLDAYANEFPKIYSSKSNVVCKTLLEYTYWDGKFHQANKDIKGVDVC